MITINLIGTGNVAWHLSRALVASKLVNIQQVGSRMPILHREFSKVAQGVVFIEEMKPAPITIIAVNDQSIKKVSEQIPYEDTLVVHTSGSISMESLSAKNRKGVFYPLQTFSKSIKVDFTQIPICLETEHENDRNLLREIAFALSENVYQINSIERKQLHLAAVFANNFVNHCYTIAEELCAQQQLPFELLKPLIETTCQKAIANSPLYTQTGPAMRKDENVMDEHIHTLQTEEYKTIYRAISDSISKYYGKKL